MPTTSRRQYRLVDAVNAVATNPNVLPSKARRGSTNRFTKVRPSSETGGSLPDEDIMIEERYLSYVESIKSDQSTDNRYPSLLNVASLEDYFGDSGATDSGDAVSIIDIVEDSSITDNSLAGCNVNLSDGFSCVGANAFCSESDHQSSPAPSISDWQREYKAKLLGRYERIVEEKGEALRQAHRLHETLTATNDSTVKTLTQRCHSLEALNKNLQAEIQNLQDRGKLLESKYKELQHQQPQRQNPITDDDSKKADQNSNTDPADTGAQQQVEILHQKLAIQELKEKQQLEQIDKLEQQQVHMRELAALQRQQMRKLKMQKQKQIEELNQNLQAALSHLGNLMVVNHEQGAQEPVQQPNAQTT